MRSILFIALAVSGVAFPGSAWAQNEEAARRLIERGERLFERTCMRCHNEMEPDERTNRQWEMIVPQMREIANITREEARAIMAYLIAENDEERAEGSERDPGPEEGHSVRGRNPAERAAAERARRSGTSRSVPAGTTRSHHTPTSRGGSSPR